MLEGGAGMAGGCLVGPGVADWWLDKWLKMAGIGLLGGWLCSREEEREVCVITWL